MRTVEPIEPPPRLGAIVRPPKAEPTQTLRQVPGARPGVVSDASGAFRTVPLAEVRR